LEFGSTDIVADRIIQKIESSPRFFIPALLNELYKFLFNAGYYSTLIGFAARHMNRSDYKIPWAFMIDSLALSLDEIPGDLVQKLKEAIDESQALQEILIASNLEKIFPELSQNKNNRVQELELAWHEKKMEMLGQLLSLRAQQLFESEKKCVQLLLKRFPKDADVKKQIRLHQEIHAYEIISRHAQENRAPKSYSLEKFLRSENLNNGVEREFQEILSQINHSILEQRDGLPPEMIYNLVIMLRWFEDWDRAIELLNPLPLTESVLWLRVELLLEARRHLELIETLNEVERLFAHNPETFFAAAYFRAQAYWGLGQKNKALEVLESLLSARPLYRSATSLLREWQGLG